MIVMFITKITDKIILLMILLIKFVINQRLRALFTDSK